MKTIVIAHNYSYLFAAMKVSFAHHFGWIWFSGCFISHHPYFPVKKIIGKGTVKL
jgi:hypothetical protein